MLDEGTPAIRVLAEREAYREARLKRHDPIAADRMRWRAQTSRHLFHLLPGQFILELGCGRGNFARELACVSRGENPITAVTFAGPPPPDLPASVAAETASALPGHLRPSSYDFIVVHDLLDRRSCTWTFQQIYDLLKPGGKVLLYESNPWNVVLTLQNYFSRACGRHCSRGLMSRPRLYELMSEIGFVGVFAVYNDFVYAPLTPRFAWFLRNMSIVLENTPVVRTLARSILVHAQKPPRRVQRPRVSFSDHERLRGSVSVVIPCRNEAMNIEPLVERLRELFDDYIHEIIPVDDSSTDGTRAIMRRLAAEDPRVKPLFRVPPNGVGRALADGYRAATGRYVLSMDADFQHLLPEFRDLFDAAAEGADVVIGSRFSRHSVLLNYPFTKIVANRAFHLAAQGVMRQRFRDLTNNLKLMRRDVVTDLQLHEEGFAANAEIGLQALLMGYTVREVPISWLNRDVDMGTSSFRLLRAGGGYWRVLARVLMKRSLNAGAYRSLPSKPHYGFEGSDPAGAARASRSRGTASAADVPR